MPITNFTRIKIIESLIPDLTFSAFQEFTIGRWGMEAFDFKLGKS